MSAELAALRARVASLEAALAARPEPTHCATISTEAVSELGRLPSRASLPPGGVARYSRQMLVPDVGRAAQVRAAALRACACVLRPRPTRGERVYLLGGGGDRID